MPYLRPLLDENGVADFVVRGADAPVLKDLGNGLLIAYVVDLGNRLKYVQRRDLEASGITESELHRDAMCNLAALARDKLRVQPHRTAFVALLDGNFEASLILLDGLWDKQLATKVTKGFVAVLPVRDVLAFCDIASVAGIQELCSMVSRVPSDGDHLLTRTLYRRHRRSWIKYES